MLLRKKMAQPISVPKIVSQQPLPNAIVGNGGGGDGRLHKKLDELVETMASLKDLAPMLKASKEQAQALKTCIEHHTLESKEARVVLGKLSTKLDAHETRLNQQQMQVEDHEVRLQKVEKRQLPAARRKLPGGWCRLSGPERDLVHRVAFERLARNTNGYRGALGAHSAYISLAPFTILSSHLFRLLSLYMSTKHNL